MSDWPKELSRRLRFLIHRQLFESDLDEEMRLHKQLREEYRNEGVDAPPAVLGQQPGARWRHHDL
ncbi:MAG: hypothetical protein DMG57_08150 [Acidobacteria bacterium]|nr:MAG: hypothetical protein DMG57_08150 [Acidobacteriota bacterium]